jgi:cob(I)alamin adenosyltransferase
MRIYTKKGDDGTTGLLYGGRVYKDAPGPEAYGAVDEAVAALGTARAISDGPLADRILELQRDLFVVGAELATDPENREKLERGVSMATRNMVERIEEWIDELVAETGMPTEFIVPGGSPPAAALDLARTIVRRAERRAVHLMQVQGNEQSSVVPYLNRLADYLFMLARAAEEDWTPSRKEE